MNNNLPYNSFLNGISSLIQILQNGMLNDFSKLNFNTNIAENNNEYIITAELPGFNKDDINISINGNYLTISANRKEETYYQNGFMISKGVTYRTYSRTFYVENINQSGINGIFNNGILMLKLPKSSVKASKLYLLK